MIAVIVGLIREVLDLVAFDQVLSIGGCEVLSSIIDQPDYVQPVCRAIVSHPVLLSNAHAVCGRRGIGLDHTYQRARRYDFGNLHEYLLLEYEFGDWKRWDLRQAGILGING